MAWLIPMEPQGRGTSDVEALGSYILRLAHLLAATPGLLLTLAIHRIDPSKSALELLRSPICALLRPRESTRLVVSAISEAMGQPDGLFESMTFLATSDALQHPKGSFSPRLRWCPACFEEFEARELPIYYKLIWQLSETKTCEIHNLRLRDRCGGCGASQDSFDSRNSFLHCIRCSHDLRQIYSTDRLVSKGNHDAIDLVDSIARSPGIRFPDGGVAEFVREVFDFAWANEEEAKLYRLIPRDECLRIASGDVPITLRVAARIAHRLRVPLVDLLAGQVVGTNHPIDFGRDSSPTPLARESRKAIPSEAAVHGRLHKLLLRYKMKNAFPSPRQISCDLGISVDAFRDRFPVESMQVARDYLHFRGLTRQRARTQTVKLRSRLESAESTANRNAVRERAAPRNFQPTTESPANARAREVEMGKRSRGRIQVANKTCD
jgi:hypothetical protein